jgi:hypothetical protein
MVKVVGEKEHPEQTLRALRMDERDTKRMRRGAGLPLWVALEVRVEAAELSRHRGAG